MERVAPMRHIAEGDLSPATELDYSPPGHQDIRAGDIRRILRRQEHNGRRYFIRCPARCMGARLAPASSRPGRCISVAIGPGETALTRIPSLATSRANPLVALAISHRSEVVTARPERSGIRLALRRAIDKQLRCEGLRVEDVARSQGITRRYVHKLFEESGTTFGHNILEQRLEGAARDLRNP
jgi:AraC-like DNA-binding protein